MLASPPRVPGYRVLRPIGQGGMGAVFLVEPEAAPGAVRALKVLPAHDAARQARFRREAELLARVEGHPALARVHAAGEHGGQPWIVMEYVEGEDLARLLVRQGPLPWRQALERVAAVADGLARVHALGVLHRDIKPANIIITRDVSGPERVVLIDFGVATAVDAERLTRTGVVVGTAAYLSPEAVRGQPQDARSDVYALGATLFELLTGRLLFDGESVGQVFGAILKDGPPAPGALVPGVPPAVDALVLRAVAKDPALRPQGAAAFAVELRALLSGAGTRRTRRSPMLVTACVAAGALGGVAVAWRAAQPRAPAQGVPAPAPAAPPRPTAPAPARNPLLDSIPGGAAEALRAVKLARDRRLAAPLVDEAVEARLRAAALEQARARPLDVAALVDWLEAIGIVRDAFSSDGRTPPLDPSALGDAVLEAACGLFGADLEASSASQIASLFEALVASRLRPGDRASAEGHVQALGGSFTRGALGVAIEGRGVLGEAYDRIMLATVDLDLDVDGAQLREPAGSGYRVEVIRVRARLAGPRGSDPAVARQSIELAKEHAARLGPVTRARLLTALPRGELVDDSLRRLDEAKALDPESAYVRMVRAMTLRVVGRFGEAADEVRAAITRRGRRPRSTDQRVSPLLDDFQRNCVRIFLDAGALEDAERVLDSVEAPGAEAPSPVRNLRQELEALKATRAGAGTRAPRGF